VKLSRGAFAGHGSDEECLQLAAGTESDRMLGLAAASRDGADAEVERILARHSNADYFTGQFPGQPRRKGLVHVQVSDEEEPVTHPAGRNVTTGSRAHGHRNHTDRSQPSRGNQKYPGVGEAGGYGFGSADDIVSRAVQAGRGDLFDPAMSGQGTGEAMTSNQPRGSVNSYGPKSPAQRQREETRALGGGRAQSRISR
jgi:hypothetical protein